MSTLAELRPLFTVRKDSIYKFLFYSFLLIGYFNAVLRTSLESGITLFRVLLPVMILVSFVIFKSMTVKYCAVVIVLLIYALFTTQMMSNFETFNVIYFLHYCTIIFVSLLTLALIRKFGIASVYNHLRNVYILMIAMGILQFYYPYELPNTYYRQTINAFYWVENDLSTALAAFIPFLLMSSNKKYVNWVLAFLGIAIIIYNSSRIALLALIFFIVFKILNRFGWMGYAIAALTVLLLFLLFKDFKLESNTLYQLLVEPFGHIFSLSRYDRFGSIYDRTNALIFGIKELIASSGFGIGPGNATAMFKEPKYFLPTAESMHNFIAHIIVEYGWLMLIILTWFLIRSYNIRRRLGIKLKQDRVLLIYLITVSLASLTQSEGLFSNYYFFVCLFTSVTYFGNRDIKASATDDKAS